jgi:hypothetical protein
MVAHTPLGEHLMQEGRAQTWLAMHLSARLGRPVYRQEVHLWCRGDRTPEPATREAIASILKVPVAALFPAHGQGVSPTDGDADDGVGTEKAA